MSFLDVKNAIKGTIRTIAAEKNYNKEEFSRKSTSLESLAGYRAQYKDKTLIEKIIAAMPESDFCKITEVKDCVVGPAQSCTCVKVMVFGNDDVKGKLCEKFTVHVVETTCNNGNLALGDKCVATSVSDSCEAILITANSARTLEAKLVEVDNKVTTIGGKVDVADNKIDHLSVLPTIAQQQGNSIEEVIAENKLLKEKINTLSDQIKTLSDRVEFHDDVLKKFICSSSDYANLQAQELYGVLCAPDKHDEL